MSPEVFKAFVPDPVSVPFVTVIEAIVVEPVPTPVLTVTVTFEPITTVALFAAAVAEAPGTQFAQVPLQDHLEAVFQLALPPVQVAVSAEAEPPSAMTAAATSNPSASGPRPAPRTTLALRLSTALNMGIP
jgi:hypothetical protein